MKQNDLIGVVIVTYASSDVILPCLESLMRTEGARLRIVVCDNASPDDTRDVIREWARAEGVDFTEAAAGSKGDGTASQITLLTSPRNLGYAGGVNLGIEHLRADQEIDLFWVLNPDCTVLPETACELEKAARSNGPFSLMGGRIYYDDDGGTIQSDGGKVSLWTGRCRNLNQGLTSRSTAEIQPEDRDFISGAHLVASRAFLDQAGPMPEDYFLYYEEVDWAQRRGDLPLAWCPTACVLHEGGTSIGSGAVNRAASAFSNYFNFRNRMTFIARHNPWALPVAYGYSALKIIKILLTVGADEARGAWRGLNFLSPPEEVAARISPEARALSFGQKLRVSR